MLVRMVLLQSIILETYGFPSWRLLPNVLINASLDIIGYEGMLYLLDAYWFWCVGHG